jgi:hypothetical protein
MGACLGLLLATSACTPERDQSELFAPQDIGILVVDAVLVVDESNPLVRLSKTLAPDVPFTQEAAGVVGAVTYIQNLTTEAVFTYLDLPGEPGIYYSESAFTVAPETEYELWVRTAEGEILSARTLTPARFQVDEWVLLDPTGTTELRQLKTFADAGDSVYYQPENQIKYAEGLIQARFATGGAEVFAGVGYQVALFSIDPDADYVIDPPFFEEEDFEDLPTEGSSPVFTALEGQVSLPWFSIYFEGRHDYKVFALDQNWYDLVRTTPQGGGGLGFGGNAGDGVDAPVFRVNGGIGLFGSASADVVGFYVLPQE